MEPKSTFIMQRAWINYTSISWTKKTGDINWIMSPSLPLDKLDDNDNVYLEFEALYDYNLSNLWELCTENVLSLFHNDTVESIKIKKICHFDQKRCPIRFEFGKLETIRNSIAPSKRDLKQLVFCMSIKVVHKSTVGMQIPLTDYFFKPKNMDTEVVLRFFDSGKNPYKFYVDRLALITASFTFRGIFSNERNNNSEYTIEDINIPKNSENSLFEVEVLVHFFRFLHRQKQEFCNDKIEGILYLAVRYNIHFLITDCEEFLISNKGISNSKKLFFAETSNLSMLQLSVLEDIKMEILEQNEWNIFQMFHEMGPKTLKALLVKFCEEHKEDFETYN